MGKWTERYLPDPSGEFSRMRTTEEPSKPSKPGFEGFEGAQVTRIQKNHGKLTAADESVIRRWLAHIEEDDPAIITEVLNKCRADPDALAYFLRRVEEARPPRTDDRHTCRACRHLRAGHCTAKRHGIDGEASFRFRPYPDLPRRCAGFVEAYPC